ncbi:hypothetical protein BsWGS_14427 [Bradybaena similaris]
MLKYEYMTPLSDETVLATSSGLCLGCQITTRLKLEASDRNRDKRDLMNRFTINFKTDWNRQIPCKNIRTAKVSDKALDIHCDLNVTVMQVIVSWEGPAYLCSLYISGGRNIALNQNASQSSTDFRYSRAPTAANAVDGDTSDDYLYGNCPQTERSDPFPVWSVVFSRNFSVNRFLVYHRIDAHAFLRRSYWFSLQAQDIAGRPIFTDKGAGATRQNVYTVTTGPAPSPVARVIIQSAGNRLRFTAAPAVLALCEVEVYGDTVCDPGWYGRDCEHSCNCADSAEACFVSTGGCTSGCAVGFHGEGCADGKLLYFWLCCWFHGEGCADGKLLYF